jgi:hypothetical protein
MVSNRRSFSFDFNFGNRKKLQAAKSGDHGGWGMTPFSISPETGDWWRKCERGVVVVKKPWPFSPKFGATSLHVFANSPQNVAVKPLIHNLAHWDGCFALPQLLYRWRDQSWIIWIPPRTTRLTFKCTILPG